jgi:acyl carrier protein
MFYIRCVNKTLKANHKNQKKIPMNTEQKIKSIIQEVLDIDAEEITNDSHLINDLGADELQIADIVYNIENELSIKLNCEIFDLTVNDLIELVMVSTFKTTTKLLDKPRKLHYTFVHIFLRDLIFKEGINLFADLRIKGNRDFMPGSKMIAGLDSNDQPILDGLDYLIDFWNRLSIALKSEVINSEKLDYEIIQESDKLILLFVFPVPLAAGEAFYSCFIWDNNHLNKFTTYAEAVENCASYYTLELSHGNKSVIGKWMKNGTHINLGSYESILTRRQFLDEILGKVSKRDSKSAPHYVKYGEIDEGHIYSKIILSFANQLQITPTKLNRNTPIHILKRNDYIKIICNVYEMYGIDVQKHISRIAHDVDSFLKNENESRYDCGFVFLKICQHFENLLIGDYLNPPQIYYDYREIIALILQSSEFSILHDLISRTYPSLIGENVNRDILNQKDLFYNKILTIPEKFLLHNYPIDPRGLFICLIATAIAHYNFTHLEDKASKLLESASEINIKWGTYVKSDILADIKDQTIVSKTTDKNKSGCFIATAVYGSPYANEVILLKEFRDNWLLNFRLGKIFVAFYYWISPTIANRIAKKNSLKAITKFTIVIPLIKIANYLKRKEN